MPRAYHMHCIALFAIAAVLAAADARAAVSIAITPESTIVAPGAEFTVDIGLSEAGDAINGYDAVVGFDPERLELLLPIPRSAGEGALFTDACPQRFLYISVEDDSSAVTVSHVLLCAGARVTGPGDTYQLRFRARSIVGQTHLTLLDGTAAYDGGEYVEPLSTFDAAVWVGEGSAAPARPVRPRLVAVPNPFNPRTEIRYEFARSERVRLEIFDLAGRRLDTIFEGTASSGPFRFVWDGRDGRGLSLASGVYFARLTTATGIDAVTRMVLVR